jgi:FAD/FMN-containing dehydrogenase
MTKFTEVSYDAKTQTVSVGAGVSWDDVIDLLIPMGRMVTSSRVHGVGVVGFTMGGGMLIHPYFTTLSSILTSSLYKGISHLINERGLAFDTLVSIDVVLPTGKFKTVTKDDTDLWFAMRVCNIVYLSFCSRSLTCLLIREL